MTYTYTVPVETAALDPDLQSISRLVADLFAVTAVHKQDKWYVLSLASFSQPMRSTALLKERLKTAGYSHTINEQGEIVILTIDPKLSLTIPRLNILLFILTLLSVYIVPVFLSNLSIGLETAAKALIPAQATSLSFMEQVNLLLTGLTFTWGETVTDLGQGAGIEFTIAMISILLIHEMGHYVAGRRRHIITSWPYFIPAPNIIGTFGAVIKSKSPFWNRRDLLEVGAAGPIAGWIIAIGWLIYGLAHSTMLPESSFLPDQLAFSLEGESLMMKFFAPLLIGKLPPGYYYHLTEAAFAGWVGLLVTAINMLPIGQLDGGHILYGLWRRNQYILGRIALVGLFVLGFWAQSWWFFGTLGLIFGVKHPPTLDDHKPPETASVIMGVTALIILLVSFTPIPFR